MPEIRRHSPLLDALVELFYPRSAECAEFSEVEKDEVPAPYDELLVHDHHMTVTVERFHNSPVDVRVLELNKTKTHYARKILLTRQSDGAVVQYGIVRLCLDFLEDDVRKEIEAEETPLGRILIEHNVLRKVQLISIWNVKPSEELADLLGLAPNIECYGRTALIYCNGVPAVELLEIVTPD